MDGDDLLVAGHAQGADSAVHRMVREGVLPVDPRLFARVRVGRGEPRAAGLREEDEQGEQARGGHGESGGDGAEPGAPHVPA